MFTGSDIPNNKTWLIWCKEKQVISIMLYEATYFINNDSIREQGNVVILLFIVFV